MADAVRPPCLSRRRALSGAATLGLAAPVLAACGGSDSAGDSPASAAPSPQADGPLAATADVPVGSGVILEEQGVVLTQPTEGDFKAFSSICTHQGCPVTGIDEAGISCTCHGSLFSLDTGEPESGPASSPLPAVEVTVEGGEISLA
ncbi:Cytochrome bc1 complex Rieske iron-sulfur subunit [Nocardioides aquaticus]|uniref:Cytochrome bc1 complex Rieske iron-sulfur subunit n=1 Tax=Nocardioides aquaticus TaxID=160826 RepID=A0ABX8EHZ6_9ACTN|nr:Rieske (2Fe-2S) protein [Nocardioides aquaticus]QVT80121.1 Cytochrome bc1 complex Rieske iron-sulfur subunit [Nocardioides aquaticus]